MLCIPFFVLLRHGRLQESDQILAIDGKQLDSGVSHQQAIGVLQQTSGEVELIVARGGIPRSRNLSRTTSGASSMLSRTPSDVSSVSHTSITVPVSTCCRSVCYGCNCPICNITTLMCFL